MSQDRLFLAAELAKLGVNLEPGILDRLLGFLNILLRANQSTNLTAIRDYREALVKHLFDSLVILGFPEYQRASKLLDVGSGGGIPALPLAIASPDRSLSSLDATRKKVEFQTAAALELGLTNFTAYWGRAESFGVDPQHRQSYDLVLARAVAATAVLAEFTLPFVKPGGYAMFFKGQDYLPGLNDSKHALSLLGGQVERVRGV